MAAALTSIPTNLGTITADNGYTYQLTQNDLLWLARAVQFEGGSDHAATVWAYAQMAVRRQTQSLAALIRAHSQTVNPLWASAKTAKCIANPEHCTPAHLARRERARTITWGELNPSVRALVVAWAEARVPNPVPRAVDFANQAVSEGFIRRRPGTEIVKKAGNWYLATPDVLGWPRDFVTVRHEDRTATAASATKWPLIAVGLAALAGGLWYYTTRR